MASTQVFIPQLNIGALTRADGRYLLVNVPAGTHAVRAQLIGFRTSEAQVTVAAGQTATADFSMEQDALALDEIIVTGTPGATQRRAIGNSVASVQASDITERAVVPDVSSLMRARTPGVRMGATSGQVGGGVPITIRGVSSLSLGSTPLIYVDGVRIDNDPTKGPDTGSSTGASALSDINPNEIESIEVIKGPAAATLYGTEASAGVIQIITKKGAVSAPEFALEVSQGTNFMRDPQSVLGTQYGCRIAASVCPQDQIVAVELYNEANDYLRHRGRFEGLNLPFPARDEDLFQNGHSQRYNLSVRGGTDQVRYFLSGSMVDDVGIVDYNTNNQQALRANVTVVLPGNLNFDVATGYVEGKTQFATIDNEGGVWHQLVWGRPANLPGVRTPQGSGFLGFQERWPQDYERTDVYRDYSRFTGSVQATHNPLDWFTQRLTFGLDRGAEINNEFLPGNANFPESPTGALNYGRPITENVTFDYSASARVALGPALSTNTSFGAQYYTSFNERVNTYGQGFPTPSQTVISQTEFGQRQIDFESIENKSLGFYLQEEIGIRDRLFLTAAVRADDNSAFGSEFDLQVYPKVSASWVVSEEPFFSGLTDYVPSLRLRSAWGQSGRQPSTFAAQTLYSTLLGPSGNGLVPITAGNPEVGPEVSTELEVGLDAAFFDQRLSTEISAYTTRTDDVLTNQQLPPSSGLTGTRQANLGQMKTWGWDASATARLWQTNQHSLELTVTGDFTKNRIESLGEGVLPTGNLQVGWPFPNVSTDYYVVSAEFSNAATGAVNRSTVMCDGGRPAVAGGPNILPGGEVIPCSQYREEGILLGPAYPTHTFSVSPTLTLFQNLQVFALAQGVYGRWLASTDAEFACRAYNSCLGLVERTNPVIVAGALNFPDDRYRGRYKADFWKLREIGLRYSLPQALVDRIGASRASLSVSGNNLWTIWQLNKTDLSGNPIYDPDYTINGSDPQATALWEMPGLSSLNASLRVTF